MADTKWQDQWRPSSILLIRFALLLLAISLLLLVVLSAIPEASSIVSVIITVSYGVAVVGATGIVSLLAVGSLFTPQRESADWRLEAFNLAFTATIFVAAYPYLVSGLFQCLHYWYGGFSGVPSASHDIAKLLLPDLSWITFSYSYFFDSATFNTSQIWSWLPTSIQPTVWWSETLVWLFCLLSDIILFAALIYALRLIWMGTTGRLRGTELEG
jgi:hypothetical protein